MMSGEGVQVDDLLCRARAGDPRALAALFDHYRRRLRHMVRLRLDHRLAGRLDASDVLQEAYLEADRRFAEYLRDPSIPVFLWLRLVTGQKLTDLHRRHLGAEMRDASREVPLPHGEWPAEPTAMARALIDRSPQPGEAAIQAEWKRRLHEVLASLPLRDRRVLELRHFEQLTSVEAAGVLGIHERAASKRYLRALQRLRTALRRLGVDLRLVLP